MLNQENETSHVVATVVEVLPLTGLAYLEGDDHRSWAVTKSTLGAGLGALHPGSRVDLTVVNHQDLRLVSAYSPLD